MKTIEVENMTAAELKERQDELAKAVDGEPDLPERYIKALITSKVRDETMGKQARTLETLQTGLESAKRGMALKDEIAVRIIDEREGLRDQVTQLERASKDDEEKYKAALSKLESEFNQDMDMRDGVLAELRAKLKDAVARGDRLAVKATKAIAGLTTVGAATQVALITVQTTVSEVLALDELESADRG